MNWVRDKATKSTQIGLFIHYDRGFGPAKIIGPIPANVSLNSLFYLGSGNRGVYAKVPPWSYRGKVPRCNKPIYLYRLNHTYMRLVLIAIFVAAILASGCSRKTYRLWADRDARCLIESRQFDPAWQIPSRTVEADPRSRMRDFHHPDLPCSRPVDDPAARKYMHNSYCYRGSKYWDKFSENAPIEQLHWSEYLPLDEQGVCQVDRQRAVDLALLHNRNYQSAYEGLYQNALALSLNRYDFHSRWFGGTGVDFDATGDGAAASRLLSNSNDLGFTRDFVGGGQFLTSLANAFVWQLGGGPNSQSVTTNLLFSLTQPLLRGAFRHIRMEALTQAERFLLYEVRNFVRFRREFYLSVVSEYLGLLTTTQALENQERNLDALRLNLAETEQLQVANQAAQIQVDQVRQQVQSGRLSILAAEQSLQDSLDNFKFLMGLPPESPIEIDTSILESFQLNDPRLDKLRDDVEDVFDRLREFVPPDEAPMELLEGVLKDIKPLNDETEDFIPEVEDELEQWKEKLESERQNGGQDEDIRLDQEFQESLIVRIEKTLDELKTELENDDQVIDDFSEQMSTDSAVENWRNINEQIGSVTKDRIATLFVLQNQIRLHLIKLQPFEIDIKFAVDTALRNRLDLRNQRGIVTDAFRAVEIAADQLQSDLNVTASANLGTDPTRTNPIRFDSSAASYSVGLELDGPLDRFAERNQYRLAQIAYQSSRRDYMELEDSIKNQLRSLVRQIKINRLNFLISRQQLIAVTRQVDEAQLNLKAPAEGLSTSRTRDLLEALQNLLDARNSLIANWVSYEISRITLFVEMDMLYLNDGGVWINEQYNPRQGRAADGLDEQIEPFDGNDEFGESESPEPEPAEPIESNEPPEPILRPRPASGSSELNYFK